MEDGLRVRVGSSAFKVNCFLVSLSLYGDVFWELSACQVMCVFLREYSKELWRGSIAFTLLPTTNVLPIATVFSCKIEIFGQWRLVKGYESTFPVLKDILFFSYLTSFLQ